MFETQAPVVQLPVYVIIHSWTVIRNGHEEHSNCEIIALRHDEATALECREETIQTICDRRKAEKYKITVQRDSSGDAHIHAQPVTDWFRAYRMDYVTIAEYTMPVPESVLAELLHKEDPHAE